MKTEAEIRSLIDDCRLIGSFALAAGTDEVGIKGIICMTTSDSNDEADLVEIMDRLCRMACAECEKCAMGLEPEKINGYWRHGHDLCRAAATHERISVFESESR